MRERSDETERCAWLKSVLLEALHAHSVACFQKKAAFDRLFYGFDVNIRPSEPESFRTNTVIRYTLVAQHDKRYRRPLPAPLLPLVIPTQPAGNQRVTN